MYVMKEIRESVGNIFCIAGTDVVIVKSGRRICGTGGCLANAPLHQNKSYFEFKIQSSGKLLIYVILFFY